MSVKAIEFIDKYTNSRIIKTIHPYMSVYGQPDGYVILNDDREGKSYHPNETYDSFSKRFLSRLE